MRARRAAAQAAAAAWVLRWLLDQLRHAIRRLRAHADPVVDARQVEPQLVAVAARDRVEEAHLLEGRTAARGGCPSRRRGRRVPSCRRGGSIGSSPCACLKPRNVHGRPRALCPAKKEPRTINKLSKRNTCDGQKRATSIRLPADQAAWTGAWTRQRSPGGIRPAIDRIMRPRPPLRHGLHHLLHLQVVLQQPVDFGHVGARTGRDPALAGAVDVLRDSGARPGVIERMIAIWRLISFSLPCGHLARLGGQLGRQLVHQRRHAAHLLDLPQLVVQVLEVEVLALLRACGRASRPARGRPAA